MGWTDLLDEKGKNIGTIGDQGWDLAASFTEEICALYMKEFGRVPTMAEITASIDFVYQGEVNKYVKAVTLVAKRCEDPDARGKWYIEDQDGALVYDAIFTKADAELVAAVHNETGLETFEQVWAEITQRGQRLAPETGSVWLLDGEEVIVADYTEDQMVVYRKDDPKRAEIIVPAENLSPRPVKSLCAVLPFNGDDDKTPGVLYIDIKKMAQLMETIEQEIGKGSDAFVHAYYRLDGIAVYKTRHGAPIRFDIREMEPPTATGKPVYLNACVVGSANDHIVAALPVIDGKKVAIPDGTGLGVITLRYDSAGNRVLTIGDQAITPSTGLVQHASLI